MYIESGDCSKKSTECIMHAQAPSYGQEVTGSGNQQFVQCSSSSSSSIKGGQLFETLQVFSPGLAARSDPERQWRA